MFRNCFLIASLAAGLFASSASAAILLTVDASNPSAVVIAATGAAASASSSGSGYGVLLHGTMASDGVISELPNAGFSLRPFVDGNAYNNVGDQGDALRLTAGGARPRRSSQARPPSSER